MVFSSVHPQILICAEAELIGNLSIQGSTFVGGRAIMPSKTTIVVFTYYYCSLLFYDKLSSLSSWIRPI